MARTPFLATAMLLAALGAAALAETPAFTDAERRLIAGDPALSALIEADPWAVRHLLDEMAERSAGPGERASPEALSDLFQILKQAGSRKPTPPK